jgi:hypothetical protein
MLVNLRVETSLKRGIPKNKEVKREDKIDVTEVWVGWNGAVLPSVSLPCHAMPVMFPAQGCTEHTETTA